MFARIVENWLTNAGEIGYQAAFTHLLASEGYRVLHAPTHHPYEHGKDIVAVSADGLLHAFQLKGGEINLSELNKIQGQLLTLSATAVAYPGIEPPRRPDRVFLVTSGRLSPPARDRLRSFNDAHRALGSPAIEVIERDQLVPRFVNAHGEFFPSELNELNRLLELMLLDGRGPFPIQKLSQLLRDLTQPKHESPLQLRRALASAGLMTAYVTGPWETAENHLGVAEAWLTLATLSLYLGEVHDFDDRDCWHVSFELARESARQELKQLIQDAVSREDLSIPDLVDGVVYSSRACLVCGYAAAFFLSERLNADESETRAQVDGLLLREFEYLQALGEAAFSYVLIIATALEELGHDEAAASLVFNWIRDLASANHPDSKTAIPDPYHGIEELLLHRAGVDTAIRDEAFAGQAYTAHIAIEWLARRNHRELVAAVWPAVSYLHFNEFVPATAAGLCSHEDPKGEMRVWALPLSLSWSGLVSSAATIPEAAVPNRLWEESGHLPYLPLLYPQRLNSVVAKALDLMVSGRCKVDLDTKEGIDPVDVADEEQNL